MLFRNVRDASQISVLAKQMYPGQSQRFVEVFRDATKEPFSYLFLDMKADQDEELRVRSKIFPDDKTHALYI